MSRPRLPPLNAIKAFEAAARLGSFTRAADELNVTYGAVSRQIRLLEDWLGVRLFLRTGRNAVPTQAGTELLAEAGPALDRLAAVSRRMQNRGRARGLLHVSALPTFAMRWLIPRLPDFQRDHPGLELRIVTASTPAEQFRMDVDAVISGPSRQPALGWNAISRRSTLAGVEPRSDEKMPAAGAGRSRTAHPASRSDVARGVATLA